MKPSQFSKAVFPSVKMGSIIHFIWLWLSQLCETYLKAHCIESVVQMLVTIIIEMTHIKTYNFFELYIKN